MQNIHSWCLGELQQGNIVTSSPGHSQILSRSYGEKSRERLGTLLHHGPEIVDSVWYRVHHFRGLHSSDVLDKHTSLVSYATMISLLPTRNYCSFEVVAHNYYRECTACKSGFLFGVNEM